MENKINWAQKLSSRKLWVAVSGLVLGIIQLFLGQGELTTIISGLVLSLGSIIGYLVAETATDIARADTILEEKDK